MGTTQKSAGKMRMMLGAMMAAFGMGPETAQAMALTAKGTFRNGTAMRKTRHAPRLLRKGYPNLAGTKLVMKAHKRKLGLTNPGGLISEVFRETKQARMLAIQANRGYGNCAGHLH